MFYLHVRLLIFTLYIYACFTYMYVCASYVHTVPVVARSGEQISWDWSYRWSRATRWKLELNPSPSGRMVNVGNHRTIFLATWPLYFQIFFLTWLSLLVLEDLNYLFSTKLILPLRSFLYTAPPDFWLMMFSPSKGCFICGVMFSIAAFSLAVASLSHFSLSSSLPPSSFFWFNAKLAFPFLYT